MVLQVDRLPNVGETILGGEFSMAAGGKGANQAVAAARAGGDVSFIARVGDDLFGEQAIAGFQRDNINVDYVIIDGDAPTGVALINVDQNGENSITVASGANASLSPDDVEAARAVIESADVLLMQLETPLEAVQAALSIAAPRGITTILNPAPAQTLSPDLLRKVSILTPNESEAEHLTAISAAQEEDAKKAAKALTERGVETVVITLGAAGALTYGPERQELVPGFQVQRSTQPQRETYLMARWPSPLRKARPCAMRLHSRMRLRQFQ